MGRHNRAVSEVASEVAPRAVVLVEGVSDRAALAEPARRRGEDLAASGVAVVAMGGATNVALR
jgi:predicted ATP-dependent endonuclease of OLD family